MFDTITYILYILYVITILLLVEPHHKACILHKSVFTYLSGSFIVSLLCCMALFGFDVGMYNNNPLVDDWFGIPVMYGTQTNPNGFALILFPNMAFLPYIISKSETFKGAILISTIFLPIFLCILLTGSRSILIATLIVIFTFRYLDRLGHTTINLRKLFTLFLFKILPLLLIFIFLLSSLIISLTDGGQDLIDLKGESTDLRLSAFREMINIIIDNPFGIGYGNLPPILEDRVGVLMGAHNILFGIIIDFGILAGLIFILLMFMIAFSYLKAFNSSVLYRPEIALFFALFIGYIVNGIAHEGYINFTFWFVVWLSSLFNIKNSTSS